MNQKIICLTIIAMFAVSVLPMTVAATETMSTIKLTQEIDSATSPLFSDLPNAAFTQYSPSGANNPIAAGGKPPAPTPKSYALTIEIDYMEGHRPTEGVLAYMKNYYAAQGITITYDIPATASVPLDNSVSDAEFLALEATYNAGPDKYTDDFNYGEYLMKYKWVLFGTTVEGSADTIGYTSCVGNSRDLVAGNFIYIADKAADDWAGTDADMQMGAEAVVLMHEFGHSIGICKVAGMNEIYCSNYYCVMSYLRTQNAGYTNQWYYCSTHWKTKNLDYYVV